MNDVVVIARLSLRECLRRKVFLVVPIATAAFLGLYALGVHYAFQFSSGVEQQDGGFVSARELTGATLLGLSMFATLFLGAVVAVFLTFTTISGDRESGLLQPIVARPVRRSALLLGRYCGAAIVGAVYVLLVYGAAVAITGLTGDWWPRHALLPGLMLAGAVLVLTAISLLGSVVLGTISNGIAVMMIYGAGLLGGLLGQIGVALASERLRGIGRAISWVLPFEGLYQAALNNLTSTTSGFTRVIVQLGPLGGAESFGPGFFLWTLAYLVGVMGLTVWAFGNKDL